MTFGRGVNRQRHPWISGPQRRCCARCMNRAPG